MSWHKAPVRKPLTVIVVVFTLALVAWYARLDKDVPQNMMYLLAALNGVSIGGYMGSSAYESRYGDGYQYQPPAENMEETH